MVCILCDLIAYCFLVYCIVFISEGRHCFLYAALGKVPATEKWTIKAPNNVDDIDNILLDTRFWALLFRVGDWQSTGSV